MEDKSLKYWKGFAVVLIAMNITLIVFLLLKPLGPRPPEMREGNRTGKYLVEKLKFNQQQESAFNKLKEAHRDSIEILQLEGKKLRKDFFDLLKNDAGQGADSFANCIAENQRKIEMITFKHFQSVKHLCIPEQKVIFNDIIQEVIERMVPPGPKNKNE